MAVNRHMRNDYGAEAEQMQVDCKWMAGVSVSCRSDASRRRVTDWGVIRRALMKRDGEGKRRGRWGSEQMKLAERAGIHFTYLADTERGERNIAVVNIVRIARAWMCRWISCLGRWRGNCGGGGGVKGCEVKGLKAKVKKEGFGI